MFNFRKLRNFIGGGFCIIGRLLVNFGSMIQVSIDDRFNSFISAYPSLSPVKKEESKETLSLGSTIFLFLAKRFIFKTHFQKQNSSTLALKHIWTRVKYVALIQTVLYSTKKYFSLLNLQLTHDQKVTIPYKKFGTFPKLGI